MASRGTIYIEHIKALTVTNEDLIKISLKVLLGSSNELVITQGNLTEALGSSQDSAKGQGVSSQ